MAGTLTISTLSDGTNSTSATNPILGSAKAWIQYKGTSTQSIRASYNVSSVTVNGTGDYTINFTNAFADANYSAVFGTSCNAGATLTGANIKTGTTPTTTAINITTFTGSGTAQDYAYVNVAVFR
jgi:hypothetical protein